ncbi:MAG TPA: lysophospholipid acyltransferase family protein [Candidatus Limnocylindrales bacterium]|nr:lysophospholipid acyltransferase family protein [Candidatus Limnocylindrales bacterium]
MATQDRLPRSDVPRWSRTLRYYVSRFVVGVLMHLLFRIRVEGRGRLPKGPALYCFNHLNWTDPFLLYATLPLRPRLYFFGPKEDDLRVGPRNRLMYWTGTAVPYRPAKTDLLEVTRRVTAVFEAGGVLAIAGEGRIHVGERDLLELQEGPAYFALRAGVPIVPIAINGTSWLGFRRTLRLRIGHPIPVEGRASREAIERLTLTTWQALRALIADAPEPGVPGPFGRWLTEKFNDWPEGSRAASAEVRGPSGILSSEPGLD